LEFLERSVRVDTPTGQPTIGPPEPLAGARPVLHVPLVLWARVHIQHVVGACIHPIDARSGIFVVRWVTVGGVNEVVRFYGRDAMLLVGGSFQLEPGKLLERSRAFVDAVGRAST
jgi:hypothetical protein